MLDPVNRLKSVFDQTARHGSYCVMTACVLDNTLDGSERREPRHVQRQPRSGNAKHFLAHSIRARTGFSDAKRVRMPVPIDRPNSMTASVSVSCAVGAGSEQLLSSGAKPRSFRRCLYTLLMYTQVQLHVDQDLTA